MVGKPMTEAFVWRVYLNGKEIDAVWSTDADPESMKRSLVHHDGYDPNIVVKKEPPRPARSKKPATESLREAVQQELRRQLREEEQQEDDELEELTGTAAAGAFATPYAFQGGSASGKAKHKKNAEQAGYKVVQGTDEAVRQPLHEGLEKEVDITLRHAGIAREQDYEWTNGKMLFYARNDADDAIEALRRDYPNATLKYPYIEFGVHPSMTAKKPVKEADQDYSGPEYAEARKSVAKLLNMLSPKDRASFIQWLKDRKLKREKGLSEAGDPYYAYRNDETKTPSQKLGRAITEVNRKLIAIEHILRQNARLKKEVGLPSGNYWKRTNRALVRMEARMHRIAQTLRTLRD